MKSALVFVVLIIFNFQLSLLAQAGIFNSEAFAADITPPLTQASLSPAAPDGDNGWYKSPVQVTLLGSDDSSGVKSINWRLDSGAWNSQSFDGTLNLAPNPSFEQTSGSTIVSWPFAGLPSSSGTSDSINYIFGSKSAKVVSVENGWSGFNNQSVYVPATPYANMTASVFVKTQNVTGTGAFFKIYALTPGGPQLLASSANVTGTTGFNKISKSFVVSVSDAYGLYLDIGLMGVGTAWFDAASVAAATTETQVVNTFSAPGAHTLDYYSVDNSLNTESPSNQSSFKIDSTAPTNWHNFDTTRFGSDHTLISQIDVTDATSGLSVFEDKFQYSVDGGLSWGYYTNLLSCSSTWVPDGWSQILLTIPPINGSTSATLLTPPVDYCNSNWQTCKIVRFKEKDLAGNESTKDICINGAWVETVGDVGSNYNISFSAASPGYNTNGLVLSKNTVTNFSSSNGWLIENYGPLTLPNYSQWLANFPTSTPLPSGKLPTVSGRYLVNSSFTISSATIPSGFSSANFSAVVFVNGNLTINSNLDTASGSSIAFIVSGDILVDKNVDFVDGFYLADGKFDTSYNGNKGTAFAVNGSVAAGTLDLNRNLNNNAETEPSERFLYQPINLLNLAPLLGDASISWRQTAP